MGDFMMAPHVRPDPAPPAPGNPTPPGQPAPRRRRISIEAARVARTGIGQMCIIATFIVLVARQALAAPIRAYLPSAAWYAPDLLVGAAALIALGIGIQRRLVPLLVGLIVLAGLAALSLMQNPPAAVALSMRQFFFLGLAVMAGYAGQGGRGVARAALIAIAALSIVGVAYDDIYGVPWKNLLFSGALDTHAVSREWWASGGERRLAGFCLSSTDTAITIAGGMVMLGAMPGWRARCAFAALAAPAVWAMLATTQKASGAAFCLVMAVVVGTRLVVRGDAMRAGARALRWLAIGALVLTVLLPVLLYEAPVSDKFAAAAPTFVQRIDEVWPTVIRFLLRSPQSLIGYGFGAAGDTASETDLQLTDNAFLFSTVTVGLALTLAGFGWVGRVLHRLRVDDAETYGALAVVTLLCINGLTANVVMAGGTGSIYLGFAIGVITRPRRVMPPPAAIPPRRAAPIPDDALFFTTRSDPRSDPSPVPQETTR